MCFGRIVDSDVFDHFLQSLAQDVSLGNRRFVARNFLLDEGVSPERQSSYKAAGVMMRHAKFDDWNEIHNGYLLSRVFLKKPQQVPTQIDRTDEDNCPETFRHPTAFRTFGAADANLDLIRVEQAQSIARRAGFNSVDELLSLAGEILAGPSSTQQNQQLNSALEIWDRSRDLRPVWASFWEDMWDLFGPDPANDPDDWPNELRDRVGLYHLNPAPRSRGEIHIFVFRYRVSALPPLKGERNLRPLAVPTVLDGRFGEAFCPAPGGQPYGFVVYLGNQRYRPRRELLHPSIQFRAEHLFRVGTITRPSPADLIAARSEHLQWLRAETDRTDYALTTDGDLL
jgi:hypothetical protein